MSEFTSDFRGASQDTRRDAAHKHKWALGAVENVKLSQKQRPQRPSDTLYNHIRRIEKGAVASLGTDTKDARRLDMLEGTAVSSSDESASSDYDDVQSPPVDAGVMYSFDASRSPTQGSQILNSALAKAVEKFEDRETAKLVKNEYEMLDTTGELVEPVQGKRAKAKTATPMVARVSDIDEEDYEFV